MAQSGSIYSSVMQTAHLPHVRQRRFAGLALTVLVHAALLLGWQMGRQLPVPDAGPEPVRTRVQWIRLPTPLAPTPARAPEPARQAQPAPARAAGLAHTQAPAPAAAAQAITVTPTAPPAASPPASPAPTAAAPTAADILQRARRDIGKIDRALRKENNPYIVLPPDSPQIRLRKGLEAAHDAVPPKLWEAPVIDELVNDTGDGSRRARVRTGNGTYCITDRPLNTSIDMIEKHGKQRITSCPQHEQAATKQEWRTARD